MISCRQCQNNQEEHSFNEQTQRNYKNSLAVQNAVINRHQQQSRIRHQVGKSPEDAFGLTNPRHFGSCCKTAKCSIPPKHIYYSLLSRAGAFIPTMHCRTLSLFFSQGTQECRQTKQPTNQSKKKKKKRPTHAAIIPYLGPFNTLC